MPPFRFRVVFPPRRRGPRPPVPTRATGRYCISAAHEEALKVSPHGGITGRLRRAVRTPDCRPSASRPGGGAATLSFPGGHRPAGRHGRDARPHGAAAPPGRAHRPAPPPHPSLFPRSIFPRRFARILAHQSVFRAICSSRVSVLPGRAHSASRRASSPRRSSSQRFQMSATVGKYGDSRRYRFTARSTMSHGNAARSSAQSSAKIRSCAGVLPACG